MTTYTLRKGSPERTRTDVVVIGVVQGAKRPEAAPGGEPVADAYGRRFAPLLASLGVSGAYGDAARVPTGETLNAGVLVVVGLGAADKLTPLVLRRAAGVAARQVGNASSVALALPARDAAEVRAVADGFLSGSYKYAGVRAKPPKPTKLADVAILSDAARRQDCVAALETAQVVAAQADRVRDLVNTPPNLLTPAAFADAVRDLDRRKKSPVQVTVLDEDELAEQGCGGVLAVGTGSDNPPRLVRLDYRPEDAVAHVALVGKGITYDSGGLTIKPGGSMATMKNDMAGAAAVVAATYALAQLEAPVAVTAYAPMAENMLSGRAMRPGDVITMYDGQTVEITNTDAEGRLVLADALAMAAESDADVVLEISTLTGPCVVALGDRIAGLFGDDETVGRVQAAAETAGELTWRLPVLPETKARLRSEAKVSDLLQHNWVRWGSASWAAAFLMAFTGDKPFAHLDIAGPAWNGGGPWGHVPSGATGYGVATLVQAVLDLLASTPGR